eukprot:TRINITY_DN20570_c0_g1_i9.p1 TRINITY_DN20570_c0_g1~~TRINITY_DN20570_c0_g1_i9.p1  ORF type:complete len:315 (-),score=29.46 TRINITY_DN20570_c0_g1_i9:41-985(-)
MSGTPAIVDADGRLLVWTAMLGMPDNLTLQTRHCQTAMDEGQCVGPTCVWQQDGEPRCVINSRFVWHGVCDRFVKTGSSNPLCDEQFLWDCPTEAACSSHSEASWLCDGWGSCRCGRCGEHDIDACRDENSCEKLATWFPDLNWIWSQEDSRCLPCGETDLSGCSSEVACRANDGASWLCDEWDPSNCRCGRCGEHDIDACREEDSCQMLATWFPDWNLTWSQEDSRCRPCGETELWGCSRRCLPCGENDLWGCSNEVACRANDGAEQTTEHLGCAMSGTPASAGADGVGSTTLTLAGKRIHVRCSPLFFLNII